MEEKTDELVASIQTLTKENDELRASLKEFEDKKALEEKEEEIKKRVQEELKKLEEEAEEEVEDKPDKEEEKAEEEPESKGVVDAPEEKAKTVVKEQFVIENGDLTMNPEYWKEFDDSILDIDSKLKDVRWIPNAPLDEVKLK